MTLSAPQWHSAVRSIGASVLIAGAASFTAGLPERASAIGGMQTFRSAIDLDLAGDLQALAIEADDRKRVLDHVLGKQGLAVAAPGNALVPSADLGVADPGESRSVDVEHDHQAVGIVEGVARGAVRAVLRADGDVIAVGRERHTLDGLAYIERMDDTRCFACQVDDADRVDVAGATAAIADNRNIALRADLHRIRANPAGQHPLGVLDLGAVDRQDRDLVVAV